MDKLNILWTIVTINKQADILIQVLAKEKETIHLIEQKSTH